MMQVLLPSPVIYPLDQSTREDVRPVWECRVHPMIAIQRLIRVEPMTVQVKAHLRGGVRTQAHVRLDERMVKLWYWTPRGYFTRVVKYGKRVKRVANV